MESEEADYSFKIIVVGASGAGKSQLLLRYTSDRFLEASKATIGVDFGHKTLNIDGKIIRTQIWDTAGQERFKAIMPKFYAGTHGALVVYSITDRNSFVAVKDWLDELHKQTDCRFVILVGNKNDLEPMRAVTKAEGQEFANANDLLFMETSAKESINVDAAFEAVIKEIYENASRTKPPPTGEDDHPQDVPTGRTVVLTPEPSTAIPPTKRCGC